MKIVYSLVGSRSYFKDGGADFTTTVFSSYFDEEVAKKELKKLQEYTTSNQTFALLSSYLIDYVEPLGGFDE